MTGVLLVMLLLASGRVYHDVALEKMATTSHTHVKTCGLVTYARTLADGDRHVTLSRGKDFVVLEIIPALPMASPRKNQTIEAWGIARIDRRHTTPRYAAGWPEIHPLEGWKPVVDCLRFTRNARGTKS
jgi:hypothetical protein